MQSGTNRVAQCSNRLHILTMALLADRSFPWITPDLIFVILNLLLQVANPLSEFDDRLLIIIRLQDIRLDLHIQLQSHKVKIG